MSPSSMLSATARCRRDVTLVPPLPGALGAALGPCGTPVPTLAPVLGANSRWRDRAARFMMTSTECRVLGDVYALAPATGRVAGEGCR